MDTVRRQWTRTDGPSEVVVATVASATGRGELDLPPLHDAVDADALDAVVTARSPDDTDDTDDVGGVRVSFTYADAEVVVDSDGWVEARPFVTGQR